MEKNPRKPDYRLGAMNKITDEKAYRIGSGWIEGDGRISIRLEPFVTITGGKDLLLTLFPMTERD